jgi:hypothetical protein
MKASHGERCYKEEYVIIPILFVHADVLTILRMSLKRTSHSVYEANYHIVWCPKYRRDIFKSEDIRKRTIVVIGEVCIEYGFDIEEMEVSIESCARNAFVSPEPIYRAGCGDYQEWYSKNFVS